VQTSRHPVQEQRRGQQQSGESEDHGRGDMIVHGLVHVEGHAPDQGEIHADGGEEGLRGIAGTAASDAPPQAGEVAADAAREDGDERAGHHERAVEERPRGVVEGSQAAEVQVPPQRIGRGQDRQQDAADEYDKHPQRELHRGHACQDGTGRYNKHRSGNGYDDAHSRVSPPRTDGASTYRRAPHAPVARRSANAGWPTTTPPA
jgi:hypothetical protein